MTSKHALVATLAIVFCAAFLGLRVSPARAQYTIPDCLVAALNTMFPSEDYAAARDNRYHEYSDRWNGNIVGLSSAQITAYAAYFCANFTLEAGAKDDDGTQHYTLGWIEADDWLAYVGQRRGSTVPTTTSGTGSTDSATTSGTTGTITGSSTTTGGSAVRGIAANGAPSNALAPLPDVPAQNLLYSSDFTTLPTELEVRDDQNKTRGGQIATVDGAAVFRLVANSERTISIPSGADWNDYTIEARVRVTDADIALLARSAGDLCAAYVARFRFASDGAQFSRSDAQCHDHPLKYVAEVKLRPSQWVVLRFTANGNQFSADVDGKTIFLMAGNDPPVASGLPALKLLPVTGKTGKLEIESLRVIQYRPLPDTLTQFAAAPGIAVAELQQLGLVPMGGQLVFDEPQAYFKGSGSFFQPLAESAPRTDVVMAGSITFTSGAPDQYEDCGLIARLTSKGGETAQETETVIDNNGYVNVYEFANPDSDESDQHVTHSKQFPPGKTYHLLFTLIGSQMVVYVDGERMLAINNLVERAGTYGIGLYSSSPKSKCVGNNIWVYSFK